MCCGGQRVDYATKTAIELPKSDEQTVHQNNSSSSSSESGSSESSNDSSRESSSKRSSKSSSDSSRESGSKRSSNSSSESSGKDSPEFPKNNSSRMDISRIPGDGSSIENRCCGGALFYVEEMKLPELRNSILGENPSWVCCGNKLLQSTEICHKD